MKLKTKHKVYVFLVLLLTAAVLCTLPFLAIKKDVVYVYTEEKQPLLKEQGFIKGLKMAGFRTVVNSPNMPPQNAYAFWFKNPEDINKIEKSPAKINFLYTEAYYPIEWKGVKNMPVILTPYRDVYEHCVRSNIKTALLTPGVDLSEFYMNGEIKKYPLTYYGDNNKINPLTDILNRENAKLIGNFWPQRNRILAKNDDKNKEKRKALAQSKIVVIYNQPGTPQSKKIPQEIMEATLSGALVFSSPNPAVYELYKDNVIYYEDEQDFLEKKKYYLQRYNQVQPKILAAEKITAENLSIKETAQRFKELLTWMKENQNINSNGSD